MNTISRGRLVSVAIALLLPMGLEQGVLLFGQNSGAQTVFYAVIACGIAAIIIGMNTAIPSLGSGLFYGGILTITKNYYQTWEILGVQVRFVTVLLALAALTILAIRGHNLLGGSAASPRRRRA